MSTQNRFPEKEDLSVKVIMQATESDKNETKLLFGMSSAAIELVKWVLSTFLLGVAAIVIQIIQMNINKESNRTQVRIKQLTADSQLLSAVSGKYITGIGDSTTKRTAELDYLTFVKTFITDTLLSGQVKVRIIEIQIQLNAEKTKLLAGVNNKAIKASNSISPQEKRTLMAKANNIPQSPTAMTTFKNTEAKELIGEGSLASTSVDQSKDVLQKINAINVLSSPIKIEDDYYLISAPLTQWCKPGYYVDFNNSLEVGVETLSSSNQTATLYFKDIGNQPESTILINKAKTTTLTQNTPITIDTERFRYQVTLNYIGAAGRNPFNKAAYITVAVYQKK